ncbi:unnamed protein product, partial [Brachionus calyciflorus]
YLYGTLTIIGIWVISMICVTLLGKFNKSFSYLILASKALAIGTLISDALLHILPAALGLHSHEDDEHDSHATHNNTTESTRDHRDPLWKMSGTIGILFVLWILDTIFHHDHDHHGHENSSKNKRDTTIENSSNTENKIDSTEQKANITVKTSKTRVKLFFKYLKNIKISGWMAFFGDILHKIADGFAIAAAFSQSLSLGLSTSLAILFHEVPHELGDYSVLVSSGFKLISVLILNTITSATGLIAYLILVSVSPSEMFREWIFAITTGVFLYIALVIMIPRVKNELDFKDIKRNYKKIIVVVAFFLIGWVIMFLLAFFEEDIKFDIPTSC